MNVCDLKDGLKCDNWKKAEDALCMDTPRASMEPEAVEGGGGQDYASCCLMKSM